MVEYRSNNFLAQEVKIIHCNIWKSIPLCIVLCSRFHTSCSSHTSYENVWHIVYNLFKRQSLFIWSKVTLFTKFNIKFHRPESNEWEIVRYQWRIAYTPFPMFLFLSLCKSMLERVNKIYFSWLLLIKLNFHFKWYCYCYWTLNSNTRTTINSWNSREKLINCSKLRHKMSVEVIFLIITCHMDNWQTFIYLYLLPVCLRGHTRVYQLYNFTMLQKEREHCNKTCHVQIWISQFKFRCLFKNLWHSVTQFLF